MFIKLTEIPVEYAGKVKIPIHVNSKYITQFYKEEGDDLTTLYLKGFSKTYVVETPDEIMHLLAGFTLQSFSYCTTSNDLTLPSL